jgi:hypothetical protein
MGPDVVAGLATATTMPRAAGVVDTASIRDG